MTARQLARLFSPDLNLSPEARALIAHVASLGESEIPYTRLGRLLQIHDDRKLRRAVAEAEDSGWITVERQTGRGHSPRFSFTPAENVGVTDSPTKNADVNPVTPAENVGVKPLARAAPPPPPPPPPPSERARAGEPSVPEGDLHLARLRRMLGPHAAVLDHFRRSAAHPASWPRDLWAFYRPPSGDPSDAGGSEWAALFGGHDLATAVRALVGALADYASAGKVYEPKPFRGYVRTSLREVVQGTTGGPARTRGRKELPPDAQEYHPKPYLGLNG